MEDAFNQFQALVFQVVVHGGACVLRILREFHSLDTQGNELVHTVEAKVYLLSVKRATRVSRLLTQKEFTPCLAKARGEQTFQRLRDWEPISQEWFLFR